MDISIKDHIIKNFIDDNIDSIYEAIDESISDSDEVTLPGLGVFFSLLWEISSQDEKDNYVKYIRKSLDTKKK